MGGGVNDLSIPWKHHLITAQLTFFGSVTKEVIALVIIAAFGKLKRKSVLHIKCPELPNILFVS